MSKTKYFNNVRNQIGCCGIWCGSCVAGNGVLQEPTVRHEKIIKDYDLEQWAPKDFDFKEFTKMNDVRFFHYKNSHFSCLSFLFCCLIFCSIYAEGSLGARLSTQASPPKLVANEFYSPFNDPDRKCFESIKRRLIGSYGEYRKSTKPGHLHAGIDLAGSFNETVQAIGCGQIYRIFRDFPHQTVIVKHHLPDGTLLFSVYTHIEQVEVSIGEWVDEGTPLARLFSKDELKRANFGTANHLHLEIRKSMADEGYASYASISRQDLNKFCIDPEVFFKTYLQE